MKGKAQEQIFTVQLSFGKTKTLKLHGVTKIQEINDTESDHTLTFQHTSTIRGKLKKC